MSEVRMVLTHGAPAAKARRTAEETLRAWDLTQCTDDVLLVITELPRLSPPGPRRIGGRGLLLVAAVALAWGTRNTAWNGHPGKVVWARLAIPPAA